MVAMAVAGCATASSATDAPTAPGLSRKQLVELTCQDWGAFTTSRQLALAAAVDAETARVWNLGMDSGPHPSDMARATMLPSLTGDQARSVVAAVKTMCDKPGSAGWQIVGSLAESEGAGEVALPGFASPSG
jgi:hypothetical protein